MHISLFNHAGTIGTAEAVAVPFHEPTVRANVLAALPEYLGKRGIDLKALLVEVGLPPVAIADRDLPISLNHAGLLFELAARRLGDPAFGLNYAKGFPPGSSGLLGHLLMTASNVRHLLEVAVRYTQVHTAPIETNFEVRDGVGWYSFTWPSSFVNPQIQYTGFAMAILILRIRIAAGPNWIPLAAQFQHRSPDGLEAYNEYFGTRLKFDQRANGIAVDASTLAMPMPELLPELHSTVLEAGEKQLQKLNPPTDAASQLKEVLAIRLLNEEPFDLDAVAGAMATNARALQWRLEQEQTTYEKVLLLTRLLQAESHLRDTDHQLTHIARLLGFSELSALTRWSQRHFKMSPSAYRKHLRDGGKPDDHSTSQDTT
jgi:AraC-like DNA-binding protein